MDDLQCPICGNARPCSWHDFADTPPRPALEGDGIVEELNEVGDFHKATAKHEKFPAASLRKQAICRRAAARITALEEQLVAQKAEGSNMPGKPPKPGQSPPGTNGVSSGKEFWIAMMIVLLGVLAAPPAVHYYVMWCQYWAQR